MHRIDLYNTLTRQKDRLEPVKPPVVSVYTCGPTVYDYAHIGHWFTYLRWDLLIRTLRGAGYQPKWVMNITDVGHLVSDADQGEDKLEKGARREGKTAWQVAEFYTQDFIKEMKQLGITMPDVMPKATSHIAEQIELIKQLESKGYTYLIDDGVYFDTAKFPSYADLARLDLAGLKAGARVQDNAQKRNPSDFALWKLSPENSQRDMEWPSPWGLGFPGWHIECSAMSMHYLGPTLDIHAGGIDHIPVHHSNEIAQSEAATGKPFAKIWIHSNHVLVDGQKISKSLGNGIHLADILAKGYSVNDLRLNVYEGHYQNQSHFSYASLTASRARLANWQRVVDLQWQVNSALVSQSRGISESKLFQQTILDCLADNLNSPEALAYIDSQFDALRLAIAKNDPLGIVKIQALALAIANILGIELKTRDISDQQKELINQRETARQAKDWAAADALRDQLAEQGIGLSDSGDMASWYRLS